MCHIKYSQSVCEVDNIPILEINKKKSGGEWLNLKSQG